MRGILFEAPGRIRLIGDAPIPVPGEGQVLVRCTHAGLCGSNIPPYAGEGRWADSPWPAPLGWTGHENVGVIERSRAEGWPEGTPVLAQAHDYNGFVEYFVARPEAMARLPQPVADPGGFIVAQPLATVLRALAKTDPVVGQSCAVVGQGPIGLLFTYMLRRMGARQVIGIDRIGWRLDWSQRVGATDVVHAGERDPVAAVRELTAGAMVDFAVEAATTPEALATATYLVRHNGRLCPFGVPRWETQDFPWWQALHNELRFVVSHGAGCMAFFQTAVDLVTTDCRALTELVTPRLPWDRAAQAFEMYHHPAEHPGSLKIALEV